jgi:hypothetical protein
MLLSVSNILLSCVRPERLIISGCVEGILIGCVIAWILLMTMLGPEADGSHFEQAKVAFQRGAGAVDQRALVDGHNVKGTVEHHEASEAKA